MRNRCSFLAALFLSLCASTPAWAHYWKLEGAGTFLASYGVVPAYHVGETRPISEGEGGQVTLVNKSLNSAEFLALSSRWGTHRIRFTWDTPPDILRPGEHFSTKIGWEISQKWTRFSPVMQALSRLDPESEWYIRSLKYGYDPQTDLKNFTGFDSHTYTVTTNDRTTLNFITYVSCWGWVQVNWKYIKVDGTAPASPNPTDSNPVSSGPPSAGPSSATPVKLFGNGNTGGVANGGQSPEIAFSRPTLLTYLMTYHWNGGKGYLPGSISLVSVGGETFGPWPAHGQGGQANAPNVYWIVNPNIVVPAGKYRVIDSDPASWAQNGQSGGLGMTEARGVPQ